MLLSPRKMENPCYTIILAYIIPYFRLYIYHFKYIKSRLVLGHEKIIKPAENIVFT